MPIIFLLFYKPPTILLPLFSKFLSQPRSQDGKGLTLGTRFYSSTFLFLLYIFLFDTHLFNKMQRTASLKLRVVFVANKISRYISLTCKNVGSYMWVLNVFQNLVEQYVCAPLDQPLRLKVSDITTL